MNKLLIKHASQIATPQGFECKKGSSMKEIFTISDGAVYIEDGIIKLMGKTDEVLNKIDEKNCKIIDAEGKCVLPGFVDSHTHFIFSGYREEKTQKVIAKELNISRSYVSRMEKRALTKILREFIKNNKYE